MEVKLEDKKTTQRDNVKLLTELLRRREGMAADYKTLMKHTGGLVATSMTFAYSKGLNDMFKLISKLIAEGANSVQEKE